jgi:DNA-binding CsgD family transcriptional regulator
MIPLTRQEWRVLRAMSLGMTSVEIAEDMGISPETVKDHRKSIHRKFNVRQSHQAVAVGYQRDLLP